jgi:hypothetical protein
MIYNVLQRSKQTPCNKFLYGFFLSGKGSFHLELAITILEDVGFAALPHSHESVPHHRYVRRLVPVYVVSLQELLAALLGNTLLVSLLKHQEAADVIFIRKTAPDTAH